MRELTDWQERYYTLERKHQDMLGRLVAVEAARDMAVAASNQNYAALQKERKRPLNDYPDVRVLRHTLATALTALAIADEFSPSNTNIMRAAGG